ncbi:class I SAM-dependent RNA methyltransferase [Polymorphobacter arshaanensis]|uniref:Class I SAM-dependent RNA methyltransferase n=1 Tax=Glacieibacterium arshaanense TaxID=2511025 RepID=A0A4Y9ET31_9SPHN|nr:class I SAM-dependent RNA methyltransferase [Polymorphobacter arshaanensis]TFU06379.1 class I SAM-dependent RNA methyltransferase [Polymorphobacter arshaanensis]
MTDWAEIVRIAGRGDGATADGHYYRATVTGDRIRVSDGKVEVDPGPNHATPPCRHFPDCGGCAMQHVSDTYYADWALERLRRALIGVEIGEIAPLHLSPSFSRRRAALRAVRRGKALTLGFNADSSHSLIDLHECHVLVPELFTLLAPLRALLSQALGEGQGAGISLTLSDSGVDVLLANVAAQTLKQIERLTNFAARHNLARLSVEGPAGVETIAEAQPPVLRFGGVPVVLPPAPFLQATRDGESALTAAVLAGVGNAPRVADLFCGLGTFALPLAANRRRVLAADNAGPAIAALTTAARGAGLLLLPETRDLFRRPMDVEELKRFDAVVFDPPRAGATSQAVQLAKSNVPRVVAVSCNPVSFAADARTLVAGGYRLRKLTPVAQFRWSPHLELVAVFDR